MILLGGFGRSARTRGWAVLDGLRSKELPTLDSFSQDPHITYMKFQRIFLFYFNLTSNVEFFSTFEVILK